MPDGVIEHNGVEYQLNVTPTPPNLDDWQFVPTVQAVDSIPDEIDLKPWFTYDQGIQGSCTGNTQAKLMRLITRHQGLSDIDFSRAFIYKNSRTLDGWPNDDRGSTILNSIKSLLQFGACQDILMPYNPTDWTSTPSQQAYQDGELHQALKYEVVGQNQDMIGAALAQGLAVSIGIVVYANFRPDNNGIIPMPTGGYLGAHNLCITGRKHSQRLYIADNSWSNSWGITIPGTTGGRCYIPYDFVHNPAITFESRTINLIEGTPTPPPPTRKLDGVGAQLEDGSIIRLWPRDDEFPIQQGKRVIGIGTHFDDQFATEVWHA